MRTLSRPVLAGVLSFVPVLATAQEPTVRDVAVLVYPGVELLDFAGPAEVFSAARAGDGRRFRVFTVAESTEPIVSQGFLTVVPEVALADCPAPDLIVVPGGSVPLSRPAVVEWVRTAGARAEVALSVCNGALLFARAGLLDGLEATTHHGSIQSLMLAAPTTQVDPARRFVDNGRVVTTAGVSAGIDGALHVVARLLGEDVAHEAARYMEYRWDPAGAAEHHRRAFAADGTPPTTTLVRTAIAEGVDAALALWDALEDPPSEQDVNLAGYSLLQRAGRPADALAAFELNTARFPSSANVWDSLADALVELGREDEALRHARRCLELLERDDAVDPGFAERVRASAQGKVDRLAAPERARIGAQAPDFALRGLDGSEHRLSALRGRPVVLEWTSDSCPAVEHHYDTRTIPELRARFAGRVAWLAIDSSSTCEERVEGIRAWRAERGASGPYLLDPSGRTGRAFGAVTTPHAFVVDAAGRLVYAGAVDDTRQDGSPGAGRAYLADALEALLAGDPIEPATTRPVGCTIEYAPEGPARAGAWMCPPCPVDCHERVYERSGRCVECGMVLIETAEYERRTAGERTAAGDARAAELVAELEAGRLTAATLLADERAAALLRDPAGRRALKGWLREHPAEGALELVAASEPGERLLVHARVVDPDTGAPVAGAAVHVYQTDAGGIYAPADAGGDDNPRLFGYVRTDAEGAFRVRTIVPGGYPGTRIPRHVHWEIRAEDREVARGEICFADDPRLDDEARRECAENGWPIATPEPAPGGGLRCTVVIAAGRAE